MMEENKTKSKAPDPQRLKALQRLPREIMASLTKEEVATFLQSDVWPESLREKLKDYLVD